MRNDSAPSIEQFDWFSLSRNDRKVDRETDRVFIVEVNPRLVLVTEIVHHHMEFIPDWSQVVLDHARMEALK